MFCSHCGKQYTLDANFCPNCGAAATRQPFATAAPSLPRIVRPRHPRLLAGVCSGFALHYGWDVTATRAIFAVLTFFTGFGIGICVYLAAWVILPDAQYTLPSAITPSGTNTVS